MYRRLWYKHDIFTTFLLLLSSIVLFAANANARSTKGIILSSVERALITLPDEVKDILVGILLGDLCLFIVAKIWLGDLCLFIVAGTRPRSWYLYLKYLFSFLLYFTNFIVYTNPKNEKAIILKENKGKSGVYQWTNKINGKRYIGSSVDLSNRLRNYFNISYLTASKDIMIIYKALLAHGFENFTLDILEYCEPSSLRLSLYGKYFIRKRTILYRYFKPRI